MRPEHSETKAKTETSPVKSIACESVAKLPSVVRECSWYLPAIEHGDLRAGHGTEATSPAEALVTVLSLECVMGRIPSLECPGGIQALSERPTGFLQCFDTVGLVVWPVKIVPKMTYNVSSGTLSLYTTTTLECSNGWPVFLIAIKTSRPTSYWCAIV